MSIFSICLISESVTDLLIHPNTMIALGWRAGLYWNANLKPTNQFFVNTLPPESMLSNKGNEPPDLFYFLELSTY
jgi:hypothetical protein